MTNHAAASYYPAALSKISIQCSLHFQKSLFNAACTFKDPCSTRPALSKIPVQCGLRFQRSLFNAPALSKISVQCACTFKNPCSMWPALSNNHSALTGQQFLTTSVSAGPLFQNLSVTPVLLTSAAPEYKDP